MSSTIKCHKKPPVYLAWKWTPGKFYPNDMADPCPDWVARLVDRGLLKQVSHGVLAVVTDQGERIISPGDYLVKAPDGSLSVSDDRYFEQEFEII